ncbi:MAG: peptidase [Solirubrobacterales bacterium]|nr:peptidase [Solirubrobacterales bacterium]
MSWFLAFAGFAALIILHEFGHFAVAKAVGMRVERFMLFFPPVLAKVRRGETEYGIGALPLGGYVKITGMNPAEEIPPEHQDRAYFRQPVRKRVVVIAAGPGMNLLIAFLIFVGLFLSQGVFQDALAVDRVVPGSPAQRVLQPGDRIVSLDGHPGYQAGLSEKEIQARELEFRKLVNSHRCAGKLTSGCVATTPVRVIVLRHGARLTLEIRPRYSAADKRMLLGLSYGITQHVGVARAADLSVNAMWRVTKGTVTAIVRIFYSAQARKQVSGVVGSYEATRQSFQFDTAQALNVLAIISLSLAVVNLFPFLPLDGGHIFWALAEKLRGRPIPYLIIERASVIGFMLVAFLFIVGLSNDIGRLRGQGFGIR